MDSCSYQAKAVTPTDTPSLTHHCNLTRFDKWNASTSTADAVHYVINGANQIACIDTDIE